MRYLILSDIHANLEALQAVAAEAAEGGLDNILCCGDVAGYGADPNACVEWASEHCRVTVRGNHDRACAGMDDLEWFNPAARAATLWTQSALTPEARDYLAGLPRGPIDVDGFQILHGSPADEDEYLVDPADVALVSLLLRSRASFFGHTHLQGGFVIRSRGVARIPRIDPQKDRMELRMEMDALYLINPGSVGQPRDGDPRAAWAEYVPEERLVIFHRTVYEVESAQRKIREAGLPEILANRLAAGR